MPKGPIFSRDRYYARIHGSGAGGNADRNTLLEEIPFNTVTTELGTMVEGACNFSGSPIDGSKTVQLDATDAGFNNIKVLDSHGDFQNTFGTGGGHCIDYNA